MRDRRLTVEEPAHRRVRALIFEYVGIAFGQDAFHRFIEHYDAMRNLKDDIQRMRDDHHGGS